MAIFDDEIIKQRAELIAADPGERENLRQWANHAAEIIENDGVGHYFDNGDALQLCLNMLCLVEAFAIKNE